MEKKHVLMLVVVVIIVIAPFFIYNGLGEEEGFFAGADSQAGSVIEKLVTNHHQNPYGNRPVER